MLRRLLKIQKRMATYTPCGSWEVEIPLNLWGLQRKCERRCHLVPMVNTIKTSFALGSFINSHFFSIPLRIAEI